MDAAIKHAVKTLVAFPDRRNGWYCMALKAAKGIIASDRVDCILTTSPPWTPAVIARQLSVRYNIPWLAVGRDLWTQYHRYDFCLLRKRIEIVLEKWTLRRASALVMVSTERAEKWRQLHPGQEIVPITLGFDPQDYEKTAPPPRSDKFVITHTGKIMGKQDPIPFFMALAELISQNHIDSRSVSVRFWGRIPHRFVAEAANHGLTDVVAFYPSIPREAIIPRQLESHLLLLFTWNDPDEPGIHPGKLFDYLGAKTPILAIGKYRDAVTKVLETTHAGVHLTGYDQVKHYLKDAYQMFREKGHIPYRGDEDRVSTYAYPSITRRYAGILDAISSVAPQNRPG
jgi:hypothetical protein